MDDPTFRLESVVRSHGELEDFEGPLALILQLLSKNKIELEDIKISLLLDQYMAYLDEMKAMDLDIASEFVTMASHLVYIKTRMLLNAEEEVSELQELISSLEKIKARDTYVRIKGVTDELAERYKSGAGLITKMPEPMPEGKAYSYSHDLEDLTAALIAALSRDDGGEPEITGFTVPQIIVYPIDKKADAIIKRLHQVGVMRIKELFAESRSRSELVATFVAVLELCKAGKIGLEGDGDDLVVSCTDLIYRENSDG
ncbi:MAG: segregation/condensation protein A [Oscillospiraceae bacterium]|nr:segregation/condensation protein A [Oscillospiraceae bacterium]